MDKERKEFDFNDRENPVPGSSAWIEHNNQKAKMKKAEKLIEDMSEDFPQLSRIMQHLKGEEG